MARFRLAAVREMLRSHWFHVPFLIIGALMCLYWYWRPPVPNKAVLAIGVAAVVMTLSDMKPSQKALWLVIVFTLAFIENRAINKERRDSDEERVAVRQRESEQFQGIAKGISESIQQSQRDFDATMRRSDQVVSLQGRALKEIVKTLDTFTGSDSYACLMYVPGQQFLFFLHRGNYPLYGVTARIVDIDQIKTNLFGVTVSVGDVIQGHGMTVSVPSGIPPQGDRFNANVFFNARNGDWIQRLRVQKTKDGWARAIRVEGMFTTLKKSKLMCETIDPQFHLSADGKVEQDWIPDSSLPRCQ